MNLPPEMEFTKIALYPCAPFFFLPPLPLFINYIFVTANAYGKANFNLMYY